MSREIFETLPSLFPGERVVRRIADTTLIYKNTKGEIAVSCGCFNGTLSEFKSAVRKTHGRNNFAKEYKALIAMARRHNFNLPDE